MASNFDAEEFIDEDFRSGPSPATSAAAGGAAGAESRAPTRAEVESQVSAMHSKLAELKRAQQALENERTSLEELRRRQTEYTHGRQEMTHHLTRGIGLLEAAELDKRREVELMAKTLQEFKGALDKINAISEESWTKSTLEVELTRANTIIENARMEWNSALVKLPILSHDSAGEGPAQSGGPAAPGESPFQTMLRQQNYAELCKLGLALTWPLALLGALAIFLVLLTR